MIFNLVLVRVTIAVMKQQIFDVMKICDETANIKPKATWEGKGFLGLNFYITGQEPGGRK